MRFDGILTAHGFMQTERPPLMWEADTDDERFIPLLGEMIVVGLNAGNELAQLTLAVSNVTVEEDDDDPEESPWVEPGDYVAYRRDLDGEGAVTVFLPRLAQVG